MNKKRILVIPSTMKGGVYYYRIFTPFKHLASHYSDKFEITINSTYRFTPQDLEEIGQNYDIVIFHNCLFAAQQQENVWNGIIYLKNTYGTKFVLDLDDYWNYHKLHPAYEICTFNAFDDKMKINLKLFEYVTTTTEYFKNIIAEQFPAERIYIFENAIDYDDKQFDDAKYESNLLRLGIAGGSSHTEDIKQLFELSRYLTDTQLKKIELVFCGYDPVGKKIIYDETGQKMKEEVLDIKDNWWHITDEILKLRFPNYTRVETKSIKDGDYGQIFDGIDVLLVPLTNNKFNRCKSELKFIECGFTGTAVIASDVIPYNNFGTDGVDCLLVKDCDPKNWAKAIKKMLRDKDLVRRLAENNRKRVLRDRNMDTINKKRADFLLNA